MGVATPLLTHSVSKCGIAIGEKTGKFVNLSPDRRGGGKMKGLSRNARFPGFVGQASQPDAGLAGSLGSGGFCQAGKPDLQNEAERAAIEFATVERSN